MTTAYSLPDTFAPAVAVYTCRCGRQTTAAGTATGSAPPGWIEASPGRDVHVCPDCAPRYAEALARSQ